MEVQVPKQPASLLILNGKSADNEELCQAVKFYRQEDYPQFVRVTWEQGDAQRYVAEAVELGVVSVSTTETPEKLKAALCGASYFIHNLRRIDTLKADSCEIRGPDLRWQGDGLVIGIGNYRLLGGG